MQDKNPYPFERLSDEGQRLLRLRTIQLQANKVTELHFQWLPSSRPLSLPAELRVDLC